MAISLYKKVNGFIQTISCVLACHILECSEGLAQEVISTIGQAFELRFKQYLKNPPKLVTPHDRWVKYATVLMSGLFSVA